MAWLRVGDNIATHPVIGKLLNSTKLDHQVKNECIGVLTQLAATSGAHLTDGLVEYGLLAQIAPNRERDILDHLIKADIAVEDKNDGYPVIQLILDDPAFMHIKRKEEVEQDNNRAKDKRTPGLYAQVRVRDGDTCRWCGTTVNWKDRRSYRAATVDSLNNHKTSGLDSLVVSCKRCNSKRGGGEELELLPEPNEKIYSQQTVDYVNNDPWCQDNGIHIEPSTKPLIPVEELRAKTADTPRSGHVPAHSEPTGASTASSETIEEPEWLHATPDRMDEIWSTTADTPRSGHVPAHSEPTGASETNTSSVEPEMEAADTSQHDDAAKTTGAPTSQLDGQDNNHASPTTADTPRSGHVPAHSEPTGASDSEQWHASPSPRPRSDLGRKGDEPRNVGSGRDGSGRVGKARDGKGSVRRARKTRRGR